MRERKSIGAHGLVSACSRPRRSTIPLVRDRRGADQRSEQPSMLAAIRAFAKSWVASLLIGLLVVSFSVWGIRDVLHPKFSDAVVTAGSHETSPNEFKRMFDGMRQQAGQQAGGDLSLTDAIAAGLDQRALTEVEAAPARGVVLNQLRQRPGFFNALGQFDKDTYQQKLASVGLTPAEYEGL